ncbi:MAG: UDP-galactopyranose mutase [Candidatus Fimivivens sp.]
MSQYDYLIVGSGITGAVFAHELSKRGKRCLVVEKRGHIAGNIYDEVQNGILIHRYGAHIFHTAKKDIWAYVNQFDSFNHFVNSPVANYRGEIYNLPFNMNTFHQLWGAVTPQEAMRRLEEERVVYPHAPQNLEEQALSLVGPSIYEKLIKGYTEKQWGQACRKLPAFIIRRLPLRFTYDNNYFNDPYQGIPAQGYTALVKKMLQNSEVRLNVDYFGDRLALNKMAKRIIYTGTIDRYFDYQLGPLAYRSLRFEDSHYDLPNYQGVAVMNFTDNETPYTRSIEHKHFQFGEQPHTIVTREYPLAWQPGQEPYYPINDAQNQQVYARYQQLAEREKHVLFCGRLAQYRYYNMDQVIEAALDSVEPALAL